MTLEQINHYLRNIFKEYGILRITDNCHGIVAGGCIAELLRIDHDSFAERDFKLTGDIDLYVPSVINNEKVFEVFINQIRRNAKDLVRETSIKSTLQCRVIFENLPELNIILCRDENNVTHIDMLDRDDLNNLIKRFDLCCVKCGVMFNNDNLIYRIETDKANYIFNRIALLSEESLVLNHIYGLLARLYKYKLKGFKIDPKNESFLKLKCCVEDIPLNTIIEDCNSSINTSEEDLNKLYMLNSETISKFHDVFSGQTIQDAINKIIYG